MSVARHLSYSQRDGIGTAGVGVVCCSEEPACDLRPGTSEERCGGLVYFGNEVTAHRQKRVQYPGLKIGDIGGRVLVSDIAFLG